MINKVKEKLVPLMREFDAENRGNRLSKEIIAGLGGFLENMMLKFAEEIIQENSEKQNKEKEIIIGE